MPAVLEARAQAKSLLSPLGVPVLYADATRPASGEYIVLTLVSAPPVGTFEGRAYNVVELQIDVWTLAKSDSRAGVLGEQAENALDAAGWTLRPSGQPLTHEGQRDAGGNLWYRYRFGAEREF
ncbi:DUF3168 domain-containing protein [Deinococcus sp. RL]|uniref:tail completion protein gp17 n=1 Tax=Deinococcus sp. RL TaxID=1489678 RepID=UPI0009E0913D|nr:DUF3168 domain-containing protein [Deinococcus sp. RL]